ncbi:MAG: glycerol-3-phosphate dehydrogenase/oxidase [Myxococcales bacterium]|nr:glycerol-3-phosphate dehydrogenase/oxidase [Myxococcales bacterium]
MTATSHNPADSARLRDRPQTLSHIATRREPWDIVVVGGGITGAGIAREAARRGRAVLLVEQRDFAWGTSSRSSKMVHGGLRYLAQADFKLTRDALRERERLLHEAPQLVHRTGYWWPHRKGQFPGPIGLGLALELYDRLAGIRDHRFVRRDEYLRAVPGSNPRGLVGGTYFTDSTVDDARLVLRVLDEAVADGARTLNYARVSELLRTAGQVTGVRVVDEVSGETLNVSARVVINATGAWADVLRSKVAGERKVRPLRGSHLVLPRARLPLDEVIGFPHPEDKRPVFVYPWEGATIVGTTDLDHRASLNEEPRISKEELRYLLSAAQREFPDAELGREDIVATWAGVRPVVASGKGVDPSKERRDHVVWDDHGLISVTGGKLTTFRLIALDALQRAARHVPGLDARDTREPTFRRAPITGPTALSRQVRERLEGRYGPLLPRFLSEMPADELVPIGDTETLVADLRWAARHEAVVRLEDLLLRRTRLGLLLPDGASAHATPIKRAVQSELGLDDDAYGHAWDTYLTLVRDRYGLPGEAREAREAVG